MTTIKDRIKEIAQYKSLSIRAFEEKCNLGRGNISNMSSEGAIGSDKLAKIIDTFPDVDIYWLLMGEHRKEGSDIKEASVSETIIDRLTEKIAKQGEEIGRLKEQIRYLEKEMGNSKKSSNTLEGFLEEVISSQEGAAKAG